MSFLSRNDDCLIVSGIVALVINLLAVVIRSCWIVTGLECVFIGFDLHMT